PYAADPSLAAGAEEAKAYPRLDWQAESTIALGPDLVLIGQNDRPITKHMLRTQGLRLYEIALIPELDAARARLRAAPRPPFRTALLVNRGGYTAGEKSLAAALLAAAGFMAPP